MEALGLVSELAPHIWDGVLELIDKGADLFDLHNDIRALKAHVAFMESKLEGIDNMRIQDKISGCSVEQILRDVACDVKDFVDECKHVLERPKNRFMKYINLPFAKVNWRRTQRVNELKKKVSTLRDQVKWSMNIQLSVSSHHQEQLIFNSVHSGEHSTLMNDGDIVGLESVLDKIKRWALEPESLPLKVIGVYGMPGVGKTTLARRIGKDMNDATSEQHFDHVVFVSLSSRFDLKAKVKYILGKVSNCEDEVSPRGGDELYELLERLNKQLEKKKYLIILDDVWQTTEGSWWNSLKSSLPKNGSCVIVTTRNKDVARSMGATERYIHHHTTLSKDNSFSLFSKNAFSNDVGAPIDSDVASYAKEITAKCGGLPLAIKVVAGIMLGKEPTISNWRKMSEHFKGELHEKDELLDSVIRMSYENLPTHLKLCFLCFSIFPEDHEISLEEVVHLWESQCLIHKSAGKTAFEKGEECFNELINRCLLLGGRKDIFETSYQTCEIHGMIRAMASKFSKEKNFLLVEQDEGIPILCSPRVGVVRGSNFNMNHFISNKFNSKWQIFVGKEIPENRDFLSFMKSRILKQKHLRVMDVSFGASNDLDDEHPSWLHGIGSLPLLSCLKIHNSRLKALPRSIIKLRNLHTLCLPECHELTELPPEIGYLKKLATLDVSLCDSLEYLPIQMESLSNLEILYGFKPSRTGVKGGCRMASLKKFPQLRKLWIQIDSSDQIELGDLAMLCELKKLEVLMITLEDNDSDLESIIRKLDCALPSPLENLHHLCLHNFPGEENPRWLNPVSLPNLHFLHIYGSNIQRFGTSFFGDGEKVWQLEALVYTNLNELEEEWQTLFDSMPSLRLLKIDECSRLVQHPFPVKNGLGTWKRAS